MLRPNRVIPFALLLATAWGCASGGGTQLLRLLAADGEVIPASLGNQEAGSGAFWTTLPDGEFLKGEHSSTAGQDPSTSLLSTPWGPITTVSAKQAGDQVSRITADGNRGTSLQCVFFPKGAHGVGGCRDSRGRQYKLYY